MTRHQFSKTHLHAAMLALHATSGLAAKGDAQDPPLSEVDEALIFGAARQISALTGNSFDHAEAAIRAVLRKERAKTPNLTVAQFVVDVLGDISRMSPVAKAKEAPRKPGRYMGSRTHPRSVYEAVLIDRWPNALDGGARAQNSGEFSIVASKLGATDEEIVAMVAAINTRPR